MVVGKIDFFFSLVSTIQYQSGRLMKASFQTTTLHVFGATEGGVSMISTGKQSFEQNDTAGEWHGQVGQDFTIVQLYKEIEHWKHPLYFVDLAANHPVLLSNTRALERDYNWKGVCIDAKKMPQSIISD